MRFLSLLLAMVALPANAATTDSFFPLGNTDFIVLVAFVIFIAAIIYFKAPQFAAKLIDGQIDGIRSQIDNAAALRREAEGELQKAKARVKEAEVTAEETTRKAKTNADEQFKVAHGRIVEAGTRRIAAAEDQLESAEKDAVQAVYAEAVDRAFAEATRLMTSQMSDADARQIDAQAIQEIQRNLR